MTAKYGSHGDVEIAGICHDINQAKLRLECAMDGLPSDVEDGALAVIGEVGECLGIILQELDCLCKRADSQVEILPELHDRIMNQSQFETRIEGDISEDTDTGYNCRAYVNVAVEEMLKRRGNSPDVVKRYVEIYGMYRTRRHEPGSGASPEDVNRFKQLVSGLSPFWVNEILEQVQDNLDDKKFAPERFQSKKENGSAARQSGPNRKTRTKKVRKNSVTKKGGEKQEAA